MPSDTWTVVSPKAFTEATARRVADRIRRAEDAINSYYALAKMNGLRFARHDEEMAVDTFAKALRGGADQFLSDPLGAPLIPNWARVLSAVPDAGDLLLEAVDSERGILNG